MDASLFKNFKGTAIERDTALYKIIENTLFRIIDGDQIGMQEVYDAFYGNERMRKAILEYKKAECAVKVENEADQQQIYIKGIVDGMRALHTLEKHYCKSTARLEHLVDIDQNEKENK